jgi:predicted ArsR family transcriptional regulator
LGCEVGVCGEAVRQQLNRLASEGMVTSTTQPRGVGRPAQVWSLTAAANARFPDAHADLTAQLLRLIRCELGDEALEQVVNARAAESKAAYAAAMEGAGNVCERVQRLADARTREGYMAEVHPGAGGDGYLLVENHCPICVAATACQSFCRAELRTFREVLGPDVSVERTEHIVAGHRRCAYRITPRGDDKPLQETNDSSSGAARDGRTE